MPVISGENYRVHVALGRSNGVSGVSAPNSSMTILDGTVSDKGKFCHRLGVNRNAWVHAVDGELLLSVDGATRVLKHGEALSVSSMPESQPVDIRLQSHASKSAHFALFDAEPQDEPYVQEGPLVMGSPSEIEAAKAAFAAGLFGSIN